MKSPCRRMKLSRPLYLTEGVCLNAALEHDGSCSGVFYVASDFQAAAAIFMIDRQFWRKGGL
jgi:hypothetical protein